MTEMHFSTSSSVLRLLMMKTGDDGRLLLRNAKLLPAQLDALHQKGHVAAQRPHGLQPLSVLAHLLRQDTTAAPTFMVLLMWGVL